MEKEFNLKVAIWMVTYNHEGFIQQAIESVINQETNFSFKIFIGEDCSIDNTRQICIEFKKKYPNSIELILHDNNIGSFNNAMSVYEKCFESEAKYVALLEGDDYWTDPFKLQKQVDFLEVNPDYEVCFTNIRIVDENNTITKEALITDNRKTEYKQKDLPIWAPTLTRVYRNRDFKNLPNTPGMDTFILLWQSKFGKIKFINEITGSYRKHGGGIYSAKSKAIQKEQIIETGTLSLELIDKTLYSKYFKLLFKKLIELRFLEKALFRKNKAKIKQAFKNYKKDMSLGVKLKVRCMFLLVSLPFINKINGLQNLFLKICDRLFSY
ncbi:glycosyltransferase [Lacinutrix sp. MEBiC02404]